VTSRAIVLNRKDYGESDLLVQMLSLDWGLLTVSAKAAKKSKRRYVGGLDIFCHNEISIRGEPRELVYLNELTVLNAFLGIREDLNRLTYAGSCVQWIQRLLAPHAPMPEAYYLLGQTLALLEKSQSEIQAEKLSLIFKIKLVSYLGISPEIHACGKCKAEEAEGFIFDIQAGGILCSNCMPGYKNFTESHLGKEQLFFWREARSLKLSQWETLSLTHGQILQLQQLTTKFTIFHTHTRLI